jgi:hypothetical protein
MLTTDSLRVISAVASCKPGDDDLGKEDEDHLEYDF